MIKKISSVHIFFGKNHIYTPKFYPHLTLNRYSDAMLSVDKTDKIRQTQQLKGNSVITWRGGRPPVATSIVDLLTEVVYKCVCRLVHPLISTLCPLIKYIYVHICIYLLK